MLGFCPLASGSKGNSLFIGTTKTRILVDLGISARAVEQRLQELHIDPKTLEAILVTHEHTDHIQGIAVFAERYRLPVLANASTAKGLVAALQWKPRFKIFTTGEPFHFGDLEITPFSVPHDTLDPVGFVFQTSHYKLGLCTDLGHVTAPIRRILRDCNALILESNHQPSMVHACNRPAVYKTRVLGKQGHLSNEQSSELLKELYHSDLTHVHLAHLSSECNHPDLALKIATDALAALGQSVDLSIAWQEKNSRPIECSF